MPSNIGGEEGLFTHEEGTETPEDVAQGNGHPQSLIFKEDSHE